MLPVLAGGCRKPAQGPPQVTISGKSWYVDLAMTGQHRLRGLAGRDNLNENAGMLFIYPTPRVLVFCMRGCVIPLDIAFISRDMRVVKISTMQVEPGLTGDVGYSSQVPVMYTLEVPAGALRRAGVRVGDKVIFSDNIPSPAKAQDGP